MIIVCFHVRPVHDAFVFRFNVTGFHAAISKSVISCMSREKKHLRSQNQTPFLYPRVNLHPFANSPSQPSDLHPRLTVGGNVPSFHWLSFQSTCFIRFEVHNRPILFSPIQGERCTVLHWTLPLSIMLAVPRLRSSLPQPPTRMILSRHERQLNYLYISKLDDHGPRKKVELSIGIVPKR
jgi:hypothetical protein